MKNRLRTARTQALFDGKGASVRAATFAMEQEYVFEFHQVCRDTMRSPTSL